MATARLIPSTYSLSNTSLTVSDASNFYSNTDSTSYGSVATTSTSSRYIYLKGFNFDDIPSEAIVNSFTVKYKASESTLSTSSSYYPRLCNNTTTITGTASGALTTSVATYTFTGVTADWDTISGYGDNFAVRFTVRRSGNSGTGYLYLYGVEIYVDYTVPTSATVTSTLTGSGTINPSGATSTYEGAEYTLTITPTNGADTVTVKNNGTDVTSQLVPHYPSSSTSQTATGFTTEINGSGGAFYTGSSTTGNYFSYAVGHTAESPGSTSTSYNTYVKDGGSNTATGYAWYSFDFSGIPSGATISSVEVKCYGACESTTHDSTHKANIVLYSGSTAKSIEQYFTSTSNATITISSPGTWTRAELQNAKLRFEVAYYGGRLFGITWTVAYSTGSDPEYYIYTYTVTGNATIAVTIGSAPVASDKIYYKGETTYSELYSGTETSADANSFANIQISPKTLLTDNDLIVVEGTVNGVYSGGTKISNAAIHIELVVGLEDNNQVYSEQVLSSTSKWRLTCTRFSSSSTNFIRLQLLYYFYISNNWAQGDTTGEMTISKVDRGDWIEAVKVYKKVNGSWVEQSDLTTVFDQNTNYVKYTPVPLEVGPITVRGSENQFSNYTLVNYTDAALANIQEGDTLRITADDIYTINVGSTSKRAVVDDVDVSFTYSSGVSVTLGTGTDTAYGNPTYTASIDPSNSRFTLTATWPSNVRELADGCTNLYIRRG